MTQSKAKLARAIRAYEANRAKHRDGIVAHVERITADQQLAPPAIEPAPPPVTRDTGEPDHDDTRPMVGDVPTDVAVPDDA